MYFIGIDISKYKHDCFIMNENNQVIRGSFSFDNSQEGFNTFLDVLKSLDRSQEIKIGLEQLVIMETISSSSLMTMAIPLWNLTLY